MKEFVGSWFSSVIKDWANLFIQKSGGKKKTKQIFFLPSPTLKEIIKIIQNIIRKYPEANMTGIKSPD